MFAGYINTFLKIKQQASGWPRSDMTEEEKLAYIEDYRVKEGVVLDYNEIKKNPGMRAVGKLALNSLWGRLAMRENMLKYKVVRDYQEFEKYKNSNLIEVHTLKLANKNNLYISWKFKEEVVPTSAVVNVPIACYTTAQARLVLYEYLNKLGKRVLYYDTDSVIYISENNGRPEYEPPLGDYLGSMTDELAEYGEGSYISHFVSTGPKSYAYRVATPSGESKDICKVKGVRLNYENSEKINFESLVKLVEGYEQNIPRDANKIVIRNKAIRKTALHDVVTVDEEKTVSVVLEKRIFDSRDESHPIGYKKQRLE